MRPASLLRRPGRARSGFFFIVLFGLLLACRDQGGSSANLFGGGVLYAKSEVAILRTDPSTYGFEVDTIRKGEAVKVLDRTGKKVRVGRSEDYWYLVQKENHVRGWIFGTTLSRIPTSSGPEVVQGPDMVVVQANLPGEWWEINQDGSTGFRRLKFEPQGNELEKKDEKKEAKPAAKSDDDEKKEVILAESGKFQYFFGKSGGVTVEYHIDPRTRKIRLNQDTPIGQELELLDLGEEFRLISAKADKKFAFKKGYDTDEDEKEKKEEAKKSEKNQDEQKPDESGKKPAR